MEVYIGMGSNLEGPKEQLLAGLQGLERVKGYTPLAVSSPYVTSPVGPQDQPLFYNAVAKGRYQGEATELLNALLGIEQERGRVRGEKWGPRTLDMDLLLFGREIIDLPVLKVPHPEMPNRVFVLEPLAEIAPDLVLPVWNARPIELLLKMPERERLSQKIVRTQWESPA